MTRSSSETSETEGGLQWLKFEIAGEKTCRNEIVEKKGTWTFKNSPSWQQDHTVEKQLNI